MSPCKGDIPTFVDNKDKLGDKRYERKCWFLFTYLFDINIERLISYSNKHNLYLKNILSSNNKRKHKIWQVVVASTIPCVVCSSAIFNLFFVDSINWKFLYLI